VDVARAALARAAGEAEGRVLAARVVVQGATRAHVALREHTERVTAELRAAASEIGADAWVEKVLFETRAALDLAALRRHEGAIGELARAIDALRGDDAALRALSAQFEDLRRKLPIELRDGDDALKLDDPAQMRALLDDVEQAILPRLVSVQGES